MLSSKKKTYIISTYTIIYKFYNYLYHIIYHIICISVKYLFFIFDVIIYLFKYISISFIIIYTYY